MSCFPLFPFCIAIILFGVRRDDCINAPLLQRFESLEFAAMSEECELSFSSPPPPFCFPFSRFSFWPCSMAMTGCRSHFHRILICSYAVVVLILSCRFIFKRVGAVGANANTEAAARDVLDARRFVHNGWNNCL